jgi:hypothetical protein
MRLMDTLSQILVLSIECSCVGRQCGNAKPCHYHGTRSESPGIPLRMIGLGFHGDSCSNCLDQRASTLGYVASKISSTVRLLFHRARFRGGSCSITDSTSTAAFSLKWPLLTTPQTYLRLDGSNHDLGDAQTSRLEMSPITLW